MSSGRKYDDQTLIEKVKEEYASGRARSYGAAALALALAGEIPGGGTPESKARRIAVKAARREKSPKLPTADKHF
jgi:hypothetical protein